MVHKFCPQMGLPKRYKLHRAAFCSSSSCSSNGKSHTWADCPSVLRGQVARIPIGNSVRYRVLFQRAVAKAIGYIPEFLFEGKNSLRRKVGGFLFLAGTQSLLLPSFVY